MPYRPSVFISHSAKEPATQNLCQAIVARIDPAAFEVWWDQKLQTSQEWRSVIDEWVWRCDAAVLVLSQAATDSRYVAYEAALLRQRWKNSAGQFLLIPVWCEGITEAVLSDRMGALQLGEIQTSIKLPQQDTAQQVAILLSGLLTRLQARHDAEDMLIKQLNLGTPTEEALREIAVDYKLPPAMGPKKDLAAALARHILDFGVPPGPKRFQDLACGIDTMMAAMSDAADRVPKIINLVSPFCWVSPAGAVRVAGLSSLPEGEKRAIAWNRSWLLSERMYLYRGYCTRSKFKVKIAEFSDRAGGEKDRILEHIRSVLAGAACNDKQAGDAQLAARIKDLAKQAVPVFLLVPARAIDAAVLSEIFLRWPEVCVFLFGDELDETQVRDQFPGVEFVDPPLGIDDERAARTGWGDCMDAAGISYDDLASGAAFLT